MTSITASQIEPSMTQKKRDAAGWFCDLRDQLCTVFEGIENEGNKADGSAGRFVRKSWQRDGGGGGEFPSMFRHCFPTLFLLFFSKFLSVSKLLADFQQRNSYGQRTSGGKLIKIASIFPPVFNPNNVPRSCRRLNST